MAPNLAMGLVVDLTWEDFGFSPSSTGLQQMVGASVADNMFETAIGDRCS